MRRLLRWLGRLFEPSQTTLMRNAEGIMVDPGEPGENPFVKYPITKRTGRKRRA
jgi:hypothetical protein